MKTSSKIGIQILTALCLQKGESAKVKAMFERIGIKPKPMPEAMEILVSSSGTLKATRRGTEQAYVNEHGCADNVPTFCELNSIAKSHIICNDSSL